MSEEVAAAPTLPPPKTVSGEDDNVPATTPSPHRLAELTTVDRGEASNITNIS